MYVCAQQEVAPSKYNLMIDLFLNRAAPAKGLPVLTHACSFGQQDGIISELCHVENFYLDTPNSFVCFIPILLQLLNRYYLQYVYKRKY